VYRSLHYEVNERRYIVHYNRNIISECPLIAGKSEVLTISSQALMEGSTTIESNNHAAVNGY